MVRLIVRSVQANVSGTTPVWTPAMGLRYQLRGYSLVVSGFTTTSGLLDINLVDGANTVFRHTLHMEPAGTVGVQHPIMVCVLSPDEYLSVADNNVLGVSLSQTMVNGFVCVNAWGLEV